MKRLTIFVAIATMTISCSKDKGFKNVEPILKKEYSDNFDFENFVFPGDTNDLDSLFEHFLDESLVSGESPQLEADEAIWTAEAAVNWAYSEDNFEFSEFTTGSITPIQVDFASGTTEAVGEDMALVVSEVIDAVDGMLAAGSGVKKLLATDFYVTTYSSTSMTVGADIVIGASDVETISEAYSSPFYILATGGRKAGIAEDCSGSPELSAGDQSALNATIGYRRKFGVISSGYYQSVRTYGINRRSISSANLFGQTNAAVSSHQTSNQSSIDFSTCVSSDEIDDYISQMFSDAANAAGSGYHVLSIKVQDNYLPAAGINLWRYDKVRTGERNLASAGYEFPDP